MLFCLIFSTPSFSVEPLNAAVFDITPISYYNNENELTGVMPEFIHLLSTEMGVAINIRRMPYGRMLKSLADGSSDFAIFYFSETAQQQLEVEPLIRLQKTDSIVVGLKGTVINHYDDLKSLKIAMPRGIFYNHRFDNDSSLNISKVADYNIAAKLLISGRVDAIAGPEVAVRYNMSKLGNSMDQLGKPYLLLSNEVWLQFSKSSQNHHLKHRLKSAAEKLSQQGHFKRLYDWHTLNTNQLE